MRSLLDVGDDSAIQSVEQVKDRYDSYLLALPEVVGDGVGLSNFFSGFLAIQVYVRQTTPQVLAAVPSSLDGVPVVMIEVGDIIPQQREINGRGALLCSSP